MGSLSLLSLFARVFGEVCICFLDVNEMEREMGEAMANFCISQVETSHLMIIAWILHVF